jgi:hypothetical protein
VLLEHNQMWQIRRTFAEPLDIVRISSELLEVFENSVQLVCHANDPNRTEERFQAHQIENQGHIFVLLECTWVGRFHQKVFPKRYS